MAGAVSRWLGAVDALPEIAQRLLRVQIENDHAINVVKRYDSKETLFYCDPPYPHESRGDSKAYRYEMTNDEHRELARVLHSVKGKVALSGYRCDLLDELYGDWNVYEANSKKVHSVKTERTEILWTNYELSKDIVSNYVLGHKTRQESRSCSAWIAKSGASGDGAL